MNSIGCLPRVRVWFGDGHVITPDRVEHLLTLLTAGEREVTVVDEAGSMILRVESRADLSLGEVLSTVKGMCERRMAKQ